MRGAVVAGCVALLVAACANRPETDDGAAESTPNASEAEPSDVAEAGADATRPEPSGEPVVADVIEVAVSGSPGAYQLAVTLRSPDTGCEQYADWWEVLDAEGNLLTRRILAHSHVDEQPFTRSGGPVEAGADDELWVRAHMHGEATRPDGYGGQVLRGRPDASFAPADASALPALHEQAPLPDGCAF